MAAEQFRIAKMQPTGYVATGISSDPSTTPYPPTILFLLDREKTPWDGRKFDGKIAFRRMNEISLICTKIIMYKECTKNVQTLKCPKLLDFFNNFYKICTFVHKITILFYFFAFFSLKTHNIAFNCKITYKCTKRSNFSLNYWVFSLYIRLYMACFYVQIDVFCAKWGLAVHNLFISRS